MTNELRRELVELLPRLRRFAYALTGDPHRADDLVQEACVRAFANLHQFQPGTRLNSWMFKIVRNLWLNEKRAFKVREIVTDLESAPEPVGEDGRTVVESRLTLSRVLDAMSKLPHEQRLLIALVCIEGLSYQEAADILEIPVGTVTSRLGRGRRALYAVAVEGVEIRESEHDEIK
jgi:RNA polymerase sigma-70 factor (ECF subfamily)